MYKEKLTTAIYSGPVRGANRVAERSTILRRPISPRFASWRYTARLRAVILNWPRAV